MPNVSAHNRLELALSCREAPAIIVPVCEQLPDELIGEIHAGADAAELRVDLLQPCPDSVISRELGRLGSLPILATIRSHAEGGKWLGPVDEKLALFEHILSEVDGIDVELQSAGIKQAISLADGKVVVASMHDFQTTPHHLVLESRLARALDKGADYFKVAVTANDEDELAQILGFMERNPHEPIIAVTMGRLGVLGRLELLGRGSRATYTYVGDAPLVPGQLSLAELVGLGDVSILGLGQQ